MRYERLLYSIALRCGLSEDDAADVFQTVCVKLLENLEKLRDDTHLTGWLILTARHESWRLRRRKQRYSNFTEVETEGEDSRLISIPAEDPTPDAILTRLEEQQIVRMAMQKLGENCRTLLRLRYQTDPPASYEEIARQMNISLGAVGPTRMRCLKQLRKILEEMDF